LLYYNNLCSKSEEVVVLTVLTLAFLFFLFALTALLGTEFEDGIIGLLLDLVFIILILSIFIQFNEAIALVSLLCMAMLVLLRGLITQVLVLHLLDHLLVQLALQTVAFGHVKLTFVYLVVIHVVEHFKLLQVLFKLSQVLVIGHIWIRVHHEVADVAHVLLAQVKLVFQLVFVLLLDDDLHRNFDCVFFALE
jgi:hypothetical protein